jgi:ATP-dependent DNA ligase
MKAEKIYISASNLGHARNIASRVSEIVQGDADTPVYWKRTLWYAYNPYIRFGVKMTPGLEVQIIDASQKGSDGWDIDAQEIWDLLDEFSKSTESASKKSDRLITFASNLNIHAAWTLAHIIAKSIAVGTSESTVNKAFKDFIPVFNVQLAAKFSEKKIKATLPAYVEIKHDGMRAIGKVFPTWEVEIVTRKGHPIPAAAPMHKNLVNLAKAYKKLTDGKIEWQGMVSDGELMGGSFNETMSAYRSSTATDSGFYHVFDILPMQVLTVDGYVTDPFRERRELLRQAFELAEQVTPFTDVIRSKSFVASSVTEIYTMYEQFRADGHEGAIIKTGDGTWQCKRTSDWQKIKACETEDLPIIGAFEGEGEMVGMLGGFIVDRGGVHVQVGSGLKLADRIAWWEAVQRDFAKARTGITDPEEFEIIGCLAEINYQEVTPDGSLRHPVFIRLRKDKNEVSF